MMLRSLNERIQASAGLKVTLQAVITKVDTILGWKLSSSISQIRKGIIEATLTCLEPILTSTAKHPYTGIDVVRDAIIQAFQR